MSPALATLDVLVVDGQSTGASPAHGHLLELGWARTTASAPEAALEVEAHLLALPPEAEIPRAVTRLTGIGPDDVSDASEPSHVWSLLRAAVGEGEAARHVVIHYARFEVPFLRALHEGEAGDVPLPFSVVCTHEIARRLLPGLPRRGLRALAGYLGLGASALKRSAEHVRATAFVWRHLVQQLADEAGVVNLAELVAWLEQPPPRRPRRRAYPMDRDKRLALPDAPGVYRMLRSDGGVLYVGKATSLRSRVNGYFRQHRRVADRTLEMLTQARDLDVTVTPTALEAALLESDEIKAHQPPYNVMLRARGQGPWYASRSLEHWGEQPTPMLLVGPLASRALVQAWAALCRAEPDSIPEPLAELRWGTEPLPIEVWREGWAEFARAWGPWRGHAGLASVGARIWQQQRQTGTEPEAQEPGDEVEPGDEDAGWDAPRVVAFLERIAAHGAHELRRAAWVQRLGVSTVVWARREQRGYRQLTLDHGAVVGRDDLDDCTSLPYPPRWSQARPRVPLALDEAGFDRLRVLTAQLRRLVTEGREVHVRCTPRVSFTALRLARALAWI